MIQLLDWSWEKGPDLKSAMNYARKADLKGFHRVSLPQGLVAAGFFANAVLTDFDRAVMSCLGTEFARSLIFIDICRYVDDIRMVIGVPAKKDADAVLDASVKWLDNLLSKNAPGLLLNSDTDKTSVAFIGESKRTLIPQSKRMDRVQHAVSGGFDAAGGMEILAEIESLFKAQDQFGDERAEMRIKWPFMAVPDVRDETVARFGANRFRSTFRSLRPLLEDAYAYSDTDTNQDSDEEEAPPELLMSKYQLDAHARAFSTGLIERWLRDPSHVRLLRIALDIYPDDDLLTFILGLFWKYIGKKGGRKESRLIALYCFSEILRAGAIEMGFVDDKEALPSGADISQYRSILLASAHRLLNYASKNPYALPWYLIQQALLFVSIMAPEKAAKIKLPRNKQIKPYLDFVAFLAGRDVADKDAYATCCILALRSYGEASRVIKITQKHATADRLEYLARIDAGCAEYILLQTPELRELLGKAMLSRFGLKGLTEPAKVDAEALITIGEVARSTENPLRNESALLHFVAEWLKHINENADAAISGFYPGDIFISFQTLATPSNSFVCLKSLKTAPATRSDVPFTVPIFAKKVGLWRWALGSIILFAVRGSASPIPLRHINKVDQVKYRPTASEWVARFFGGYFGRDRLGDPSLPISTWLDNFLIRLLAWPGCLLNTKKNKQSPISNISNTKQICLDRHNQLEANRGLSSRIMFLKEHVGRLNLQSKSPDKSIRICVAQTVIPIPPFNGANNDWDRQDPQFNNSAVRPRLRRHLAAVLAGVTQMLTIRDTHRDRGRRLDWLILPELSVHPDDIRPILLPFARRHKCLVLAGLLYHPVQGASLLVNEALWLLPTRTPMRGTRFYSIYQGKRNLAPDERRFYPTQITRYRPCQWLIEYDWSNGISSPLNLTGSICYDATDLSLASDLRDRSDIYAIPALNKDVNTFDTMTQALHYHMYQMVILANNGSYGGSNAYVPYQKSYRRQIFHVHGQPQASITFLEIDKPIELIRRGTGENIVPEHEEPIWKSPPAGWRES